VKLRAVLGATLACGLTLIPDTASAKGVQQASVSGPGLRTPIHLGVEGTGSLAEAAGLYAAFFQTTSPLEPNQPPGDLGPRYIARYTYAVPERQTERQGTLRQELYPFAANGAVTYTPPGEKLFQTTSRGGWHRADAHLTMVLVAAGVPVPASAQSHRAPTPVDAAPRLTG
jgi:hypothetical protein